MRLQIRDASTKRNEAKYEKVEFEMDVRLQAKPPGHSFYTLHSTQEHKREYYGKRITSTPSFVNDKVL